MLATFDRHIDKHGECKFVLASESGKFIRQRIGGNLPASYPLRYGRGAAAYFMPMVFQNLLAKIGFGATLSAYYNTTTFLQVPREKIKLYYNEN